MSAPAPQGAAGGAAARAAAVPAPLGFSRCAGEGEVRPSGAAAGTLEVGPVIGRGAAGRVHAGSLDGVPVAVKVVPLQHAQGRRAGESVRREVAAMRTLDHPGIVSLLDVRRDAGHLYLVTERMAGGDLLQWLQRSGEPAARHMPFAALRRVLSAVTDALLYAHGLGVCHRDIKPENILTDRSGAVVKLADWGLARAGRLGLGTRCGSAHNVAPEVIRRAEYDGFQADVWSLGVTAFTLATGYLPFDVDEPAELARRIGGGLVDWDAAAGVPKALGDLLRGMLTVDPAARLTMRQVRAHPFLWDAPSVVAVGGAGVDAAGWAAAAAAAAAAVPPLLGSSAWPGTAVASRVPLSPLAPPPPPPIPSAASAFREVEARPVPGMACGGRPAEGERADEEDVALEVLCDLELVSSTAEARELVAHPERSQHGGLERELFLAILRRQRRQRRGTAAAAAAAAATPPSYRSLPSSRDTSPKPDVPAAALRRRPSTS